MNINFSKRLANLPPYLFVEISRIINEKKAAGIEVISFGIGDPDLPTPDPIISRLISGSKNPDNHRYPETDGLPEVRESIAKWYKTRFNVDLNSDKEVVPLIGAKEGIGHIALCLLDKGDICLVPDPGYPVYSIGTMFAGGETYWLPLTESNDWLPDLDSIPTDIANKAKCIWLNYPNNPTSAIAPDEFFKQAIEFANKYNVILLHDAAYSEVYYDAYKPKSFLEYPGAKEVGIEFHSLSKSYNMTGWRMGMAVGNSKIINALFTVKSNLDSGIPQAIQEMSIQALEDGAIHSEKNNAIYQNRRNKLVECLHNIGIEVEKPKASLYLWAKTPQKYSSKELATILLEEKAIVVTPGSSYGKYGEGFVRLSLTTTDENINKAIERLKSWKIPVK